MADNITSNGEGILTPPASSVTTSHHPSPLPQPRRHPLKPGGNKEGEVIGYLDRGLNDVQKRVDNRTKEWNQSSGRSSDLRGYSSFTGVEKDLEGLIDVVWVTGSPKLQFTYLLNITGLISDTLPLFPSAPHATFRLLEKLDAAFSSLLLGHDPETNEPLPGFDKGFAVSTTDKVRLKGVVERTRLIVARKIGRHTGEPGDEDTPVDTEDEDMTDADEGLVKFEGFDTNDEDEDEWEETHVGSVFEKTIAELGDVLGGPPIGIITEDWSDQKMCG
ncbi:hypothetical protein BU24DRAFT_152057 [Aaosphaeria arxii CBS 175.79]|uniref:Meiotic recombination protein DMC1 n=1 Tax=Aaosphaeria arxii CBS 175.79 TaxID=1450172 RepID=A0A6A5XX89_9PLEO|nr:uncharacterized protein BU24DRAFT_152057 [Aaosphaeria arxii CBS 175.79]KAF2017523.1 hypothetical protein BU24DRAFT_152057 [Aaosphaeria arxii CBS 175.79]